MSSNTPPVTFHPLSRESILPQLNRLLPYTLPIVRRIQMHLQTSHSHCLATFPVGESPPSFSDPFAIAYFDRSRAPETECWLFSSIELPSRSEYDETVYSDLINQGPSNRDEEAYTELARHQVQALLAQIYKVPIPDSYPSSSSNPHQLKIGALNRRTLDLLTHPPLSCVIDPETLISYRKFLFSPAKVADMHRESESAEYADLGDDNFYWSTVPRRLLQQVISRTEIVRKEQTLALLSSAAIMRRSTKAKAADGAANLNGTRPSHPNDQRKNDTRIPIDGPTTAHEEQYDDEMLAWGFLGTEGALSSLHVEAEMRGRGWGKKVAARLFGQMMVGDDNDNNNHHDLSSSAPSSPSPPHTTKTGFVNISPGDEWCHANVAPDNKGSIGVMRALGGQEAWDCFWCRVDLKRGRDCG
ncbi:hypothetical protein MMC09_004072 [Bachmanniomyces sp. S44760]|nr:hypothetical protein [Bachmanniomyces sp. S44760]